MALEVRKATAGDLEPLWGLYAASCARRVPGDMGPDWHMGVYPARSDLEGRLAAGELYVGEQDGALVAGMVVTEGEDPIYAKVPWQVPAAPDEVAVLHLLVVDPAVRGRGVGSQMVAAAARVAAQAGKRTLHLDTLEQNTGAIALYKRCGLSAACVMPVHYEDIGDASTVLFELALDGGAAAEGAATAEGTAAAKADAASAGFLSGHFHRLDAFAFLLDDGHLLLAVFPYQRETGVLLEEILRVEKRHERKEKGRNEHDGGVEEIGDARHGIGEFVFFQR